MKLIKIIKGVISYILALILAIIFALYLNANVGWFMLIALILAPVMSVFFAWITSKCIGVTYHMDECVMSKGDKCCMVVNIKNQSIFPTTPIELVVLNGEGVKSKEERILCSVGPRMAGEVKITYEARISGPSVVGVEQIRVTDYLGLVSFKIKKSDDAINRKRVKVIPDIAEISIKDDRILKIMQLSMNADDSEDTVESSMYTFGGFPGYENREYVPGDPLKRINWKQSAKRDKLLVRLDDEMASRSATVILDSVFIRYGIDIDDECFDDIRHSYSRDEILPKLAEDAVENALGIIRSLVFNNYSVNFYVRWDDGFESYSIDDDKDVENIRLLMAGYSFLQDSQFKRFPIGLLSNDVAGIIISTPCSYNNIYTHLEKVIDISKSAVFSSYEDAKNSGVEESGIKRIHFAKEKKENKKVREKLKDKVINAARPYVIPYLLAFALSITVFSVFNISLISIWTIAQAITCGLIVWLCNYAKKNSVVGGFVITILILVLLTTFIGITIKSGQYTQWFMSGGDLVENTTLTLTSLILVFTVFFTMVIFYYTSVYYRTSALLFVSMIPFIIYVKVIKEVHIVYVMFVVALNVLAFLLNTRKQRDKGKRIVGNVAGILSLILYGVIFVVTSLAIPKSEDTKYYYIFEELFLGGNTTVDLPDEYKKSNEYSGNADKFSKITNRKLYTVEGARAGGMLYLRRQVFDYYDFEKDRWYKDKSYQTNSINSEKWYENTKNLNNKMFADALLKAQELSPGFLEKYGLTGVIGHNIVIDMTSMDIRAHNYESDTYITPEGAIKVRMDQEGDVYITPHGIFGNKTGLIYKNIKYSVVYYDIAGIKDMWIKLGISNLDRLKAEEMRKELIYILLEHGEDMYANVVQAFDEQAKEAYLYGSASENNSKEISERIRKLALEITKDCKYDWEKAEALAKYFHNNGFVYDLEYDASDDSVEYFVFNSKTGTCSDFATAYVLMARAVGLTVRYVEGFVPDEEIGLSYETEYVVRTKCSHAYPEVYIENLGYIVYEPTVSVENERTQINGGFVNYALVLGYRILLIFAALSAVCIVIIFIVRVLVPVIQEKLNMDKIKKAEPKRAIPMLYKGLVNKYGEAYISNGELYTPNEYGVVFNKLIGYDIMSFIELVEKAAYRDAEIDNTEVAVALKMYYEGKKALKLYKKKIKRTIK